MKAEDLRKAILQAAVQGKLVPQDKNDEPASELLKRIQVEKNALIKEGKLKKEKPLPPISEDEIPYDLPDGWAWCRLGNIGDWGAGATPLRTNQEFYRGGTINWLKTGELNDNVLYESLEKITPLAIEKCSLRINNIGDILIAMYGATIGKLAIVGAPMTTNQACCGCTTFNGIYNKYLFFYLKACKQNLIDKGEGGAQPNISKEKIKMFLFSLPPFAEQQRIVFKVNELMAMCDELEAAEKELDALENRFSEYLPKSILQAAMQGKLVSQDKNDEPATELLKRIQKEKVQLVKDGKLKKEKPLPPITEEEIPYDLPDGWVWCRLGNLIIQAENQNIQNTEKPDTMIHYVDIDAIDNKNYCIRADKYLPVKSLSSRARRVLKKGYILYSLVRPYLNNIAIVDEDKDNYIGSTGFSVFKPIEVSVSYFKYLLLSPYISQYYEPLMSGFNSPSVSQTDFLNTPFPLPPIAEQQRIVTKVAELIVLCEELKQARIMPIAKVVDRVFPFPATTYKHEPVGMAARGTADDLSAKAIRTIANLFEEED